MTWTQTYTPAFGSVFASALLAAGVDLAQARLDPLTSLGDTLSLLARLDAALPGVPDGLQHQLEPLGFHQVRAVWAGGFKRPAGRGAGHSDLPAKELASDCPMTRGFAGGPLDRTLD